MNISTIQHVLDTAPDAMLVIDVRGRIVAANGQCEALLQWSRDELIGRSLDMLVPDGARAMHREHVARYAAEPSFRPMGHGRELRARRKDGVEIDCEISLAPTHIDGAFYVTAALRDLGGRRETEREIRAAHTALAARTAELEALNAELETFSHSIAHDLRAPLRGVLGLVRILVEDHAGGLDAAGRQTLDELAQSARQMETLIEGLLLLARVRRGPLEPEEVDLGALALRSLARRRAEEPGRQVRATVAEGLMAHLDPRLAVVMIDNLIDNAWKFTRDVADAHIEIGVERREGTLVVFVRDNGAGFEATRGDRLFAPFQRLHPAREFPGTGIGLATVQRIVQRHGGRVSAEGAVGLGATFRVELPEVRG